MTRNKFQLEIMNPQFGKDSNADDSNEAAEEQVQNSSDPGSEEVVDEPMGKMDGELDVDVEFSTLGVKPVKEIKPENLKPSPEVNANIISKLIFWWAGYILSVAAKKRKSGSELEASDIYDLPKGDKTSGVTDRFEKIFKEKSALVVAKRGGGGGDDHPDDDGATILTHDEANDVLFATLKSLVGKDLIIAGIFKLFNSSVQFSYPILLGFVLEFIERYNNGERPPLWEGYILGVGLTLAAFVKTVLENQYFYRVARAGWQVRSALTTAVYRKSLRLTAASRQSRTVGELVNVMQLDTTKLELFVGQIHILWDGLYQIVGYMTVLYFYIEWSAFVGLGVMVLAIPLQMKIMGVLIRINRSMVGITDSRVKVTNEALQGILGVKMSAWEEKFVELIANYRSQEVALLKRSVYYRAFSMAYMSAVPALTAVASVVVYATVLEGNILASILFAAINTFGQLRFPLMMYPNALAQYANAKVSHGRVAKFMAMEEIKPNALEHDESMSDVALGITEGTFYWGNPDAVAEEDDESGKKKKKKGKKQTSSRKNARQSTAGDGDPNHSPLDASTPVLTGITLHVKKEELLAIVGPVASGKSSLCNAMLGELHKASGKIHRNTTVAYASQSPWIFNASFRDNILFGEPFDEKRYWKVIKVCQLEHDIEVLEDGDMTMIGERGINLSGGQKQRISIARAAYSKKETVILDDPLSALDNEVARALFKECIEGFLKHRTRVLVTNQLNVLPKCDRIMVVDSLDTGTGTIKEQGTYVDLMNNGQEFASLLDSFNKNREQSRRNSTAVAESRRESSTKGMDPDLPTADTVKGELPKETKKLMTTEERSKGAVAFSVYLSYMRAGGGILMFCFIYFWFILSQGSTVLNSAWITIWTGDSSYENNPFEFYLVGYALTAVLLAVLTYVRSVAVSLMGIRAAVRLHNGLLEHILDAPMSFFDTTPIGRVISRFSKDVFSLDNETAQYVQFTLFTTIFVVFTLGTIAFTTPYFLIVIPFLAVIYFRILQFYRPVIRDAKRLESIARSPVYAHFSETLGGLSTIRAYDSSPEFIHANSFKVDESIRMWYVLKTSERWLSIRLESIGALITLAATMFAIYDATSGAGLTAGLAGLSLSFAVAVSGLLNMTVRSFSELEAGMNSVERVIYYSTQVPQEASRDHPKDLDLPENWPRTGSLEVTNLKMRYRDDTPLVLKGISFSANGGERVGIVGRTGSGKSSTILCLMRLVEPVVDETTTKPAIMLDGVDIGSVGLRHLRQSIAIVSQNPFVMSGTVRSNLDPFDSYSDAEVWEALEKCNLKQTVSEYQKKLNHPVAEYGDNFSAGQRQLLCLARAMLSKAKVLLLDEATSSVDFETDAIIQATIRNSFQDTTILTIAHRINTVITNDRILVLDDGYVAEYDSPLALLSNPDSTLCKIVGPSRTTLLAQLEEGA